LETLPFANNIYISPYANYQIIDPVRVTILETSSSGVLGFEVFCMKTSIEGRNLT